MHSPERIRSLKAERQASYSLAHWTVHTDHLTPEQAAEEVVKGWRVLTERGDAAARRDEPEAYSRWGYVGIATTDQAIYGLYSGHVFDGGSLDNMGFGTTEVHEFSWDGQFQGVYALDAVGLALAVRGTTLYLLVHDPKPAVRVYELSN